MRLFEAIVDANNRAVRGDATAGLRRVEFADSLPVAALTCIDPRLNPLVPEVFGIAEEDFIWLRNAGNIITGPLTSTMRSIALACAIKGAKEIAIVGHTDCQVRQMTVMKLVEQFQKLGLDRARLPDDLTAFFGLFGSERQNVIHAAELVRSSPIISPKTPVHGLLLDIQTGKLEWLVNGYQTLATPAAAQSLGAKIGEKLMDALPTVPAFQIGEMKFPEMKIGEAAQKIESLLAIAKDAAAKTQEELKKKTQQIRPPAVPLLKPVPKSQKPWKK